MSNEVKDVENAVTSGVTNTVKDVGSAVTGALSTANNAIQNAYASAYGTKPQNAGNPLQQFFNDIAEGSALVGYYATEGLGGAGEELAHVAQGKGLENFNQAVSQFNKAGGQNIAKDVGDVTEVALPAIATAVVAPELLPALHTGVRPDTLDARSSLPDKTFVNAPAPFAKPDSSARPPASPTAPNTPPSLASCRTLGSDCH